MSKSVKVGGHTDKIDMNFDAKNEDDVVAVAPAETEAVAEEKPIVFQHEGKKVYEVKNGVYKFFDAEGKPLSDGAVDNLNQAYQEFPEFDPHGRAKDGAVIVITPKEGGLKAYKQKYKGEDGSKNTLDYTVLDRFESVVKVLRGEIGHNVTKPDVMEAEKAKATEVKKPIV